MGIFDKYLKTKPDFGVGDYVTVNKGYDKGRIGFVESMDDTQVLIMFRAGSNTYEPIKNTKKVNIKPKYPIGTTVKERGGLARVGHVNSIIDKNKVDVRWNVGTYSVEDNKDIIKL